MIETSEIIELEQLYKYESILKGIDNFWYYCHLKDPRFYRPERTYLMEICNTLQKFWQRELKDEEGNIYTKIMINMPPRHGKTRTLTNFSQWILGKNNEEKIIECSYNDDAAGDFAKYTRDGITEINPYNNPNIFIFNDFFPNITIKHGTNSYYKWALEGQYFNYLGAGIEGGVTGKGGNILMIDDPIKKAEEAFNELRLDKIWNWYTGTFLSRGEAEGNMEPLEIINMTRWADGDLCGRILSSPEAKKWFRITFKAYDENTNEMLCDSILSKKRYDELKGKMVSEIFNANYNQEPINQAGKLYKKFMTYDKLPMDKNGNKLYSGPFNYTDTADEGDDYLCSINFVTCNGEAFILNILYTKEGMEITEPLTAEFIKSDDVLIALIESNNGGRGFARSVKRILKDELKHYTTVIKWFHQSENKKARINAASAFVQNNIYFPINWQNKFPDYFNSMNTYLKEGKNKHDDAEDATTGIAEKLMKSNFFRHWG